MHLFSPEDLLAHADDMMDRITAEATKCVQQWQPSPETLPEILEEIATFHDEAASYHGFILSLFAKHGLLLDAEGATPLDPRTEQLDRDFNALTLAVSDAARPAPTTTVH